MEYTIIDALIVLKPKAEWALDGEPILIKNENDGGDLDDPDYKIKVYKFEEYIRILIANNHWLSDEITKDPDSGFEGADGKFYAVEDGIRAHVEHNNFYLHEGNVVSKIEFL